jgi:hypothetical protein
MASWHWRHSRPRTYARASQCVSYTEYVDNPDGTRTILDGRIFSAPREVTERAIVASAPTAQDATLALIASLPAITEGSY